MLSLVNGRDHRETDIRSFRDRDTNGFSAMPNCARFSDTTKNEQQSLSRYSGFEASIYFLRAARL